MNMYVLRNTSRLVLLTLISMGSFGLGYFGHQSRSLANQPFQTRRIANAQAQAQNVLFFQNIYSYVESNYRTYKFTQQLGTDESVLNFTRNLSCLAFINAVKSLQDRATNGLVSYNDPSYIKIMGIINGYREELYCPNSP